MGANEVQRGSPAQLRRADGVRWPTVSMAEFTSGALAIRDDRPSFDSSASFGRYLILEERGRGAMGVVSRAYDTRLRREVALKLVRADVISSHGQDELVHEARAMAKLSHPNVVAVYEVDEIEGSVVVAMEFVRGTNLHRWLREKERHWSAILEHFIAAGRGLAAAHAVGLLHRDFKPANVLVGEDGRVRVTDFGLAQLSLAMSGAHTQDDRFREGESSATTKSEASFIVGTPMYMSPEQWEGRTLDVRSDVFSFCVALWKGLCGTPPFVDRSRDPDDALALRLQGPPRWPANGPTLPRSIVQAIARGLHPRPEERWPGMPALLHALDPGRHRRRRRTLVLLACGGLSSLAAVGMGRLTSERRCEAAEDHVATLWNGERREAVERRFAQLSASYVDAVRQRVVAGLDRYRDQWVRAHTEACRATTMRGEQSARALDAKMSCLQSAKREFAGVVELLLETDLEVAEKADEIVGRLPPLHRCSTLEGLSQQLEPPRSPEITAAVETGRNELARARSLESAGKYAQALSIVEGLSSSSGRRYPPFEAELTVARARLLDEHDPGDRRAGVEDELRGALNVALQWRHWPVGVEAATLLAAVSVEDSAFDVAESWVAVSSAMAERLGERDREPTARAARARVNLEDARGRYDEAARTAWHLLDMWMQDVGPGDPRVAEARVLLGRALSRASRYTEALEELELAYETLSTRLGTDHPAAADARAQLGAVLMRMGNLSGAQSHLEQVVATLSAALGPDHLRVAYIEGNLAVIAMERGEFDVAERKLRRIVPVLEQSLGATHPKVALGVYNLGVSLHDQGKLQEAETHYRDALHRFEQSVGLEHPEATAALYNLGICLRAQGRDDEAIANYRQAIESWTKSLGASHVRVNIAKMALANMWSRKDELDSSERLYREALESFEATLEPTHPLVAHATVGLGILLEKKGLEQQALELVERAWEIRQASETGPVEQAEVQFALARLLVERPGQRERALELAREAREAYASQRSTEAVTDVASVDEWLRQHQRRTRAASVRRVDSTRSSR